MKLIQTSVLVFVLGLTACMLTGCPKNSSKKIAGKWQYVVVDAASSSGDFRASLTFGKAGSGGMGNFRYEEQRLLPDDDEETTSWKLSYYASGSYRAAPYGHPDTSDIFTYWADTELNVTISEYAPVLTQSYDDAAGLYTYTLEPVYIAEDIPMTSHAVLSVNPFDELVISWGNRNVGEVGTIAYEKEFSINEGIIADTYVRVSE
ncbi:MAG: hypothetical protein KAH38_05075 [Candidatus Hydrogenedentes bacterium]|nr:hypothetical protein [Candidatus Hydrogenedentota bacterium]